MAGKGLPISCFVAGPAFALETQQNSTAGIMSVWATTRSAKPLLSHRRISTPRLQSVGFEMLGEDSNILNEGREHGAKDGRRFRRVAREKELGEQSKAWLHAGMKTNTDTLT